jgi:hypothetical protein
MSWYTKLPVVLPQKIWKPPSIRDILESTQQSTFLTYRGNSNNVELLNVQTRTETSITRYLKQGAVWSAGTAYLGRLSKDVGL